MNIKDAGTTENNFILPAPPVGGLPISQDRLDRMNLVRDHTTPIIFKWEEYVDYIVFKIRLFITPNMAEYPTKNKVFIGKKYNKNTTHTFISPSQSRHVPVSYVVKLGDTKMSVKIIYLDATESFICSRASVRFCFSRWITILGGLIRYPDI